MPYTAVIPKPLMPIGDVPILEVALTQLRKHGFKDIIVSVGHLADLINAFFKNGKRLGVRIKYAFEDEPLGTAGPISLVINQLKDDFLIMNGDVLTTLNYKKMFAYHKKNKAAATIGLYQREVKIDFGVIKSNQKMELCGYTEKPTYYFDVSMGVNILNPGIVKKYIKRKERLDIPELMTRMMDNGEKVLCYKEPCYWLDIGRADDYRTAIEIFDLKRDMFL